MRCIADGRVLEVSDATMDSVVKRLERADEDAFFPIREDGATEVWHIRLSSITRYRLRS